MRRLFFLSLLFLAKLSSAQNLEQFLSHPIEYNLVSPTNAKHIVWVINDHGKHTIMIRSGSDFPKVLASYPQDDGQEISQLVFSPNGTKLVFVKGIGTDQSIYIKDIASKNPPAKIANGHDPVFFPDGLGLLFSKESLIYETSLDINATPKLFFGEDGINKCPVFSPNGNEVVFVNDRGNQSAIGIQNVTTRKLRWISSPGSNDNFPVWSPDSKQIAFIRSEGTPAKAEENFVKGRKCSIWNVDVASHNVKMIWQSPADDGGYAQETSKPLTWTITNRLLFFSEHAGWNHIFSMNPDGSDLKDITPGDGETENFALDALGQNIYFDSNREDLDRRHIWKSNITTGALKQITVGEGIETNPLPSGENLFCFRSTINSAKSLVRADEFRKITLPVNPQKLTAFTTAYFVKPEKVSFVGADGSALSGQLFIDRTITGKRAGIVYIHGGPYRQMLSGFPHLEYYSYTYAFNQYLASMGYAVLQVNYHDGIGYGKKFRTGSGQESRIEVEYKDIVAAAKFLQLVPEVERTKIGIWGNSYGGYLTAMGLARNPELFKAGADLRCLNDWMFDKQDITNGWSITEVGANFATKPAELAKWSAPVLFIYGNDVNSAEYQQAIDLEKKLREKKVAVEVLALPTEIHFSLRYEDWSKVFNATKDFFDKKLK
jgi:dipeptidyl aminopeptidase/acylaminoacyl peptidase